ncbi:MAG: rhodanese-like domain-containing protein [Candidatus Hydrothermarchaeales archaeon]
MRKLQLLILAFLLAAGLKLSGFSVADLFIGSHEITPVELKTMMGGDEDFVLVDVRTPLEYEQGYIPGAILVPSYELEKIQALDIPKDKKVVVYCAVDPRSAKAVEVLSEMGYSNLVKLKGGLYEWKRSNGEVEKPTSGNGVEPTSPTVVPEEVLVDVNWLEEESGDQSIKTIYLARNYEEYAAGHIPNSVYVNPYSDIVDSEKIVESMGISANGLEELLSNAGIGSEDSIVLYDNANNLFTSRMYWILKYYGHEKVYILDEGLGGWKATGKGITAEAPAITQAEYSIGGLETSILVTKNYVFDNLENPYVTILDARSAEKYEAGHIPGAVNVDWEETVNEDGTFRSASELKDIYTEAGIGYDKEIITYCTNGYAGSVAWFELSEILQYSNVKLYDGSWDEWGSDLDLPVVTGVKPWDKVPETTAPPQTQPPTAPPTVAPSPPVYMKPSELEPDMMVHAFEGSKTFTMGDTYTLQVGDAMLYLAMSSDGCLGLTIWKFSVFKKTEEGSKLEGSIAYLSTEFPPEDITQDIHEKSDALDDYTITVGNWGWQEIRITFAR